MSKELKMLVKNLIRELQKCDPNMEVITEGCDCDGNSIKVTVNNRCVYIEREDYSFKDYKNNQDTPFPLPELSDLEGNN